MDTLDELKNYCNIERPVGALMLTGEWGCGKTYLLNTELINILKETHIFLRISLFGIMSIEEVKTEVQKKWLNECINSKDTTGKIARSLNKYGGSVMNTAKNLNEFMPGPVKNVVSGLFSINVLDFVNIETKIGDKKVVLIFDDLERACVSTTDLLGCINGYCENLGFSTIIVANEDKIQEGDNNIKYNEIKEKIIQRTVRHYPDYDFVVNSVIKNMQFESDNYKSFLVKYVDEIIVIFSGKTKDGKSLDDFVKNFTKVSDTHVELDNKHIQELLTKRPHNIRSLKCALQDFERVYNLLIKYEIPKKNEWLFSFIAFVFSARAGFVERDEEYGMLLTEANVAVLYPGYYNTNYMINGIKTWIIDGEWDKKDINCQLLYVKQKNYAILPVEKAKTHDILYLEEDEMLEGYPELLNLAYEGKLELNDYVYLLSNSNEAKKYHINIPSIDWNKVQIGVERKINELLRSHEEPFYYNMVLDDESRNDYSDSQWKVYETIVKYRNGEYRLFENNRNLYIELMNKNPHKAYEEIRNKRLDCFSDEMAEVTLKVFKKSSNADKRYIVLHTEDIVGAMMSTTEFKDKQTETALNILKCGLKSSLEQYCSSNKNSIAVAHVNNFIEVVDKLLEKLKKQKHSEVLDG